MQGFEAGHSLAAFAKIQHRQLRVVAAEIEERILTGA